MSLRILKGLHLRNYPGVSIGIMAHANTTDNFQAAFRAYPCDRVDYCDAVGGPCQHLGDQTQCETRRLLLDRTVKMCDSGIFARESVRLPYERLFETYEQMGVEYGIMIDFFQDSQATLESATRAVQAYRPYRDKFKLVGVAQGKSIDEYLSCFANLKALGFEHVAVGGLLRRRGNTVRYLNVGDENLMSEVLCLLRARFPSDWLFALGTLHPDRVPMLCDIRAWADYKGWIFQYEKQDRVLDECLSILVNRHLPAADDLYATSIRKIERLVRLRSRMSDTHHSLAQRLNQGRRELRGALSRLHERASTHAPDLRSQLDRAKTHGLLDGMEERLLQVAITKLDCEHAALSTCRANRDLKVRMVSVERRLDALNHRLATEIEELMASWEASNEAVKLCGQVIAVVRGPQREHRFAQVRSTIEDSILAPIAQRYGNVLPSAPVTG